MSLDADAMIDRRSLRRKLSLWRVLALVAAGLAIAAVGLAFGGRNLIAGSGPHVARLEINGVITVDKPTLDAIRRAKDAKAATAAIVTINSPGGTTTGSEALYRALRELSEAKPTVALVTGTAASGGYIAAMGTNRIIAPETGIVGSIGVVLQYPNLVRTLDMIGVKVESVRSSPLKAQPSGIEPTPPEATEALKATVMDTYDWFKALVKDRRKLNDAELAAVTDGRVFTGRQGLPRKLIDELGGEKEARAWLEKEHKVATSLRIVDYRRTSSLNRFGLFSMAGGLATAMGMDDVAAALLSARQSAEAQALDGLVSVWQPHGQN
jgi:protease-4